MFFVRTVSKSESPLEHYRVLAFLMEESITYSASAQTCTPEL
jgi:hypothetical protein